MARANRHHIPGLPSDYVEEIKNQLNRGTFGRKTLECDDSFILRESSASYNGHLPNKKGLLNTENSYFSPIDTV